MAQPDQGAQKPDLNEVRLRTYESRDLAGLVRLDAVCFPSPIAYSRAELAFFVRHPRSTTMVAERGAKMVGFTIFDWRRESGGRVGHFITIDVAPEERRSGIGRRMMQAGETAMAADGSAAVTLEVATTNVGAQAFYERLGYGRTGRIPGYYPDGGDALVLRKALSARV